MALERWNPGVSSAHYTEGNEGRGIVQALADVVFLEEYEAIRNKMTEAMKTEPKSTNPQDEKFTKALASVLSADQRKSGIVALTYTPHKCILQENREP